MKQRPNFPGNQVTEQRFPPARAYRRNEVILEGQKRALELAVNGGSLAEVLDIITLCAERQSNHRITASILLVAPGGELYHGSGPNVPREYREAIDRQRFGPLTGIRWMETFDHDEVVNDIASDAFWKEYKDLALRHGLAGCWSTPIFSSQNQLLATFAIYYNKPQEPAEEDRRAIDLLSSTAGIVIEWFAEITHRREAEVALKKSEQHLSALMAATTDVIYRMSADWKKMWTLYGQRFLADTTDPKEDWQATYLLPEDKKTIQEEIRKAIENKDMFQLEHRVIQVDGTIGWTLSRAIPILDDNGNISEWYGVATNITARKRYETSLAETLSLLESILKNAPVGYALFNERNEYVQVNAALATINGLTTDEHIGKNVSDILPGNSKEVTDILETVFQTGKPIQNVEIRGQLANRPGSEGAWLATFYPVIIDGSPQVKYVGAAVLEITDRIKAEQALRESEKQFRDFSNSIQNLAWMADGDGWMYWYNQRWYDYTGTTLEQMQGWGWRSVHHPDHVQWTTEFIRKAWQTGEEWELTFPLRRKDGRYHWFLTRAYPIKDNHGTVTKWIGTNTNIHENLRIQEELEKSRNHLRQISDFMPQIVWSTDADGNHDFFNKRWYEFSGSTFYESSGDQWASFVHPEDIEQARDIWRKSLATGKVYEAEYRVKRKDGQFRWFLARAMPLRRADGTIERWFGSSTDIHDQKTMAKKLEDLVQERTKELKQSNEDLQQFMHVSGHDLKEPVRKIQFFSNVITDEFENDLPQQVKVNIQKIQKSATRMAAMIEGVLLYSSLHGSTLTVENVDLSAIVKEVETDLELIINKMDAKISYANLPEIQGVSTLIYQVFFNLINNSLKFAHPQRQLLLQIHAHEISHNGRSFYEITIEDNGIGFNPIYSEVIFTTFTRLHRKDTYEGSGLGLPLCKKIIERYGGSITATGQEEVGAKFTILFPVQGQLR